MPAGAAIAVGAASSARSSSKAASALKSGSETAAILAQNATGLARDRVKEFFPLAQQDLLTGSTFAGDILSRGTQEQQRLLSQGNLNAQQTIGGGFNAIRSALLGQPVNQQAFAPQGITQSQPLRVGNQGQNIFAHTGQQSPLADFLAAKGQAGSERTERIRQILSGALGQEIPKPAVR